MRTYKGGGHSNREVHANRTRGVRRCRGGEAKPPVGLAEPVAVPRRAAQRRWAELLRRLFEVDPLECPRCGQTRRPTRRRCGPRGSR